MPEVRANGIRLFYEEHGAGTPILGIHGSGSSAIIMWAGGVEQLARLGRLILYDRRGCGRSERPEPLRITREDDADDAVALLVALDAAPAVVIGRSYGGDVALELARRHPGRVRALVLLEPGLFAPRSGGETVGGRAQRATPGGRRQRPASCKSASRALETPARRPFPDGATAA